MVEELASCIAYSGVSLAESRRREALRAAVEVAGWHRTAPDTQTVLEIAGEFEDYLEGDTLDDDFADDVAVKV